MDLINLLLIVIVIILCFCNSKKINSEQFSRTIIRTTIPDGFKATTVPVERVIVV
jgi:hypothetical protein